MSSTLLFQRLLTRLAPFAGIAPGWSGLPVGAIFVLAVTLLTACGGGGADGGADAAEPAGRTESAQPVARSTDDEGQPCADFAISIGELAQADAAWPAELAAMQDAGHGWHPGADLVQVEVGCNLDAFFGGEKDDAIVWDGIFDAPGKGNWHSADGSTYMVLTEAPLDPSRVSFAKLHDWLAAAGYDDGTKLLTIAISLDANTDGTPEERFSYRLDQLATEDGTVVRLIVDGVDGTVTEQVL